MYISKLKSNINLHASHEQCPNDKQCKPTYKQNKKYLAPCQLIQNFGKKCVKRPPQTDCKVLPQLRPQKYV